MSLNIFQDRIDLGTEKVSDILKKKLKTEANKIYLEEKSKTEVNEIFLKKKSKRFEGKINLYNTLSFELRKLFIPQKEDLGELLEIFRNRFIFSKKTIWHRQTIKDEFLYKMRFIKKYGL